MALDFLAGCLGGCAGVLVGHPFDTVKVHLQTQSHINPIYKGTFDCIRKIVKKDHISGLYRGMSSPMGGVAFLNAIVFGVYGNVQRRCEEPDSVLSHCMAGSVAGLTQSVVCSPIEMIKTRLQIQNNFKNSVKHKNPLECLKHIWRNEGFRGVFRGVGLTAARDVPGFASYFVAFETMMRREENPSAFFTLMAGGLAGTFSWLISFPVDVVKSRLQADGIDGVKRYNSSLDCIRKSYKAEGISFLSRGIGSTLIRAFPMNAVCFFVVSYTMKFFDHATIKVNLAAPPEKLTLSDSYSYPFVMRIQRNFDPDHRYNFTKYMVLLDGFHEATCHSEMIALADTRRTYVTDSHQYYHIDGVHVNDRDNSLDDQEVPQLLSD